MTRISTIACRRANPASSRMASRPSSIRQKATGFSPLYAMLRGSASGLASICSL